MERPGGLQVSFTFKWATVFVALWLSLGLGIPDCVAGAAAPIAEKSPELGEQFRALQKAWEEGMQASRAATRPPVSFSNPEEFIARYVTLAEQHPKDPATCEALFWLISRFGDFKSMDKARTLLRREYPLAGRFLDAKQDYDTAQQKFFEVEAKAGTDEERGKAYEAYYPKPEKFTGRFLEIAQEEPDSPVAFASLQWILSQGRSGDDVDRALAMLREHHVLNANIGEICGSLVFSSAKNAETLLREVADRNPNREAQGRALLGLARSLEQNIKFIDHMKSSSSARETPALEAHLGKERVKQLRAADPQALQAEAEKLFERVAADFTDVKGYSQTLAEEAKAELFEIHHLAIGKVAPDIEGTDADGRKFRLSDYRGKVVVIDFWGDW